MRLSMMRLNGFESTLSRRCRGCACSAGELRATNVFSLTNLFVETVSRRSTFTNWLWYRQQVVTDVGYSNWWC